MAWTIGAHGVIGGMANVCEIAIDTGPSTDDRFKGDDDNDNGCEFIYVDAPLCNVSSELGVSTAQDFVEEQRYDISLS